MIRRRMSGASLPSDPATSRDPGLADPSGRSQSATCGAKSGARGRTKICSISTVPAGWWLLKEPAELRPEEHALVQALGDRCAELKTSAELARAFAGMVRRRQAGEWVDWMTKAQGPGVARELCGFAAGLRQDEVAVRAALSLEWSHGPVEGQIDRLKLLKRQIDGRAGFGLLRRRFLEGG
jgi:transposase